jgi:peptidoglycan/xylan/chitin deacetylase (PgdA/CDA1 family)
MGDAWRTTGKRRAAARLAAAGALALAAGAAALAVWFSPPLKKAVKDFMKGYVVLPFHEGTSEGGPGGAWQALGLDPSRPVAALTFDDGPSEYTARVVDALAAAGARGTFCVVGEALEAMPGAARYAAERGCEVIGHSWSHGDLTGLPEADARAMIARTNEAIQAATGARPAMFRPPYGAFDGKVKRAARAEGQAMLYWLTDSMDWTGIGAAEARDNVLAGISDGDIVLFHDTTEATAAAVESLVPELCARGYQLVTASELLSLSGKAVEPGKVYMSMKARF